MVNKHAAVVVPDRVGDFSGNPGETLMSAYHGYQQVDINGQNGRKGEVGECGGNFTLISNSFTNINWLKVKLNGGNGAKGQDGDHGLV